LKLACHNVEPDSIQVEQSKFPLLAFGLRLSFYTKAKRPHTVASEMNLGAAKAGKTQAVAKLIAGMTAALSKLKTF
jgi:hypothetical protein